MTGQQLEVSKCVPSIIAIRMCKSEKRWVRHVGQPRKNKNVCKILVAKSQGKKSPGRPRCHWDYNIDTDLTWIQCKDVTGFIWFSIRSNNRLVWSGDIPSGSIKAGDLLISLVTIKLIYTMMLMVGRCAYLSLYLHFPLNLHVMG